MRCSRRTTRGTTRQHYSVTFSSVWHRYRSVVASSPSRHWALWCCRRTIRRTVWRGQIVSPSSHRHRTLVGGTTRRRCVVPSTTANTITKITRMDPGGCTGTGAAAAWSIDGSCHMLVSIVPPSAHWHWLAHRSRRTTWGSIWRSRGWSSIVSSSASKVPRSRRNCSCHCMVTSTASRRGTMLSCQMILERCSAVPFTPSGRGITTWKGCIVSASPGKISRWSRRDAPVVASTSGRYWVARWRGAS